MSMREKIEDIIWYHCEDGEVFMDAADAILAALPDYEKQQAKIAELEAFASELLDMMDWWGTGTREVAEIEEKEYRDRFAALKANEVKQ
jgi:hypothetical protein